MLIEENYVNIFCINTFMFDISAPLYLKRSFVVQYPNTRYNRVTCICLNGITEVTLFIATRANKGMRKKVVTKIYQILWAIRFDQDYFDGESKAWIFKLLDQKELWDGWQSKQNFRKVLSKHLFFIPYVVFFIRGWYGTCMYIPILLSLKTSSCVCS